MRKIIVATAGLMLLGTLSGTMASHANAATITWYGDARARFFYTSNYVTAAAANPTGSYAQAAATNSTGNNPSVTRLDSEQSYWQSRVRLMFKIETKGGAYAVGRFRLADSYPYGWDGNGAGNGYGTKGQYNVTNAYGPANSGTSQNSLRADIAYVGLPLGSLGTDKATVVIEAGTGLNTMDRFFRMDGAYNWIRGRYTNDATGTTVTPFMEKLSEYRDLNAINSHGLAVSLSNPDANMTTDDDVNNYGLRLQQKFGKDWALDAAVFFLDDQQFDRNGFGGVFRVTGNIPMGADKLGVYAGGAFKNSEYQSWLAETGASHPDNYMNGWGFFAGAKVPIGIASIGVTAGATFNGFAASGDFGGDYDGVPFVMLGSASGTQSIGMLNTGILLGSAAGNAWFANIAPSVKVSDKLTLIAESTYVQTDASLITNTIAGRTKRGTISLVEVGGIAQYQVTDGAKVSALLGYLNIEDSPENPLAFGLSIDLAF